MTNREIYRAALALLQESEADCADYEARAPMLLAAFVRRAAAADAAYRQMNGDVAADLPEETLLLELDDEFILSARFSVAAVYDLAAQLIGRDNPEFAARCESCAADELVRIARCETPAYVHPISVDDTLL